MLDLKDKGLLIHHWDTDGICSASLLLDFFGKDKIKNITPTIGNYYLTDSEIDKIKKEGYDFIIIADISIPEENILKLKKRTKAEIFIFDHHLQEEIKEVFHYNPIIKGEKPKRYPSSTCVINEYLKNPLNLLAILGAIGDIGEKIKNNEYIFPEIEAYLEKTGIKFENLLDIVDLIDSNYKVGKKENVEKAVFFLLKNKNSPNKILENEEWNENLNNLKEEIEKNIEITPAYEDDGIVLKKFHSKYNIISTITRDLAWSKGKIAIVMNKGFFEDEDQIYIRNGKNLEEILEKARERGYSAGGKKEVIGIVLPKEETEAFLSKILEELK